MCHFNKCFLGSPISFLETSQFFIHLQPSYKSKKLCHFSLKKITKCCMSSFGDAVYFLYILKNIFRDSSAVIFCGFDRFSRKFLQMSAVPGNAVHRIVAQKSSRKGHTAFSGSSDSGSFSFTDAAVPLQC